MILSVRITTFAAVGLVFFGLWKQYGWRRMVVPLVVCVSVFSLIDFDSKKNPWYTLYIGVGAYFNPYMQLLHVGNGFRLMERKTGIRLETGLGGNFYVDSINNRYREVTRS